MQRRTVGIDLEIRAVQVAQIFDDGIPVGKPLRFRPTAADLKEFVGTVVRDVPPGVPIIAVLEPTGMAWFPVAAWLEAARRPGPGACGGHRLEAVCRGMGGFHREVPGAGGGPARLRAAAP